MAARFWVSTSSTAWNNNANWSATTGGAGGVSFPVAGDVVTFDAGGSVNCILTANAACTSISITGSKTLDFSTFTLNCSGSVTINGGVSAILKGGITTPNTSSTCNYVKNGIIITITDNNHGHLTGEVITFTGGTLPFVSYRIFNTTTNTFDITTTFGNSSGTCIYTIPKNGLICNGLSMTNTGTADFQVGTRIDNYGALTIGNAAVWKTANTAIYCQRTSANLSAINGSGFLPNVLIIFPGVVFTQTAQSFIGSNSNSSILSIYGTLACANFNTSTGGGGGFFIDTNGDITGNSTSVASIYNEQAYPISDVKRTTQISHTGVIQWAGNSGSLRRPLTLWTSGEIRLGQGITNYCSNYLQPTTGFGYIMKCSKFTVCHVSGTNAGTIVDNSLNIEIQCSGQVDLGFVMSVPYEAKWNKNGTNLRIGTNNLGARTTNVLLNITDSNNLTTVPIGIYDTNSVRTSAANLTWSKSLASDDFITVVETSTPLNVNDSINISATSSSKILAVNAIPTVISKTTNNFTIPISVVCKWERVNGTAYITVPFSHGLVATDVIYIKSTSDSSTIPVGSYTVSGNSGTQIRMTCNTAGALSGTLTYVSTVMSGTLTYRYLDVTMSDSVGSGSNGTCSVNGVCKWTPGTAGKIKLTGTNQNLFTSGVYYTLYWTRVGTTATMYFKNNTNNAILAPHNLIDGQIIYIDGTLDSDTFPKGMYTITIVDIYKFSVTCQNTGKIPGTITGCSRTTTTLTIPATNHGLSTNDIIYLTYISDQQINVLTTSKNVSATGLTTNSFAITVSNAGLSTGISVEFVRQVNIFIPINISKTSLTTNFKYDVLDIAGSGSTLQLFSDFSCVSFGSSSANNIKSSISGLKRNIYVNTDDTGKNSLAAGSTIKDISLGSINRLNAKTSTNLGNNKGIVFKDILT